jgi:hypothetical protein
VHTFRVVQNVIIPKPYDAVTVGLNDCRPRRVNQFIMLAAIDLDHDLRAVACEVDSILTDRHLSSKTHLGKGLAKYNHHIRFSASVGLLRRKRAVVVAEGGGTRFIRML